MSIGRCHVEFKETTASCSGGENLSVGHIRPMKSLGLALLRQMVIGLEIPSIYSTLVLQLILYGLWMIL